MEILITGRIGALTAPFFERLQAHKVVLASEDLPKTEKGSRVVPYAFGLLEPSFEKLYHSYSFDTVLFFAERLEEGADYYNELRDLEQVLRLCVRNDVSRVLYISSTSVYAGLDSVTEDSEPVPATSMGVVLAACEKLCDYYRHNHQMEIVILHTPCLFGYGEDVSLVGRAVAQAETQGAVRFAGPENQLCDFLSQEDLAELLARLLDTWPQGYPVINVPGAQALTFSQLGAAFQREFPTVRLSYQANWAPISLPIGSRIPRQEYDFVPVLAVDDELARVTEKYREAVRPPKRSLREKAREFVTAHAILVHLVELVVGFLLMEGLNYLTRTSVQFQYIDFRLLYVVVLATLHGLKTGLAAGGLACLSLFLQYMDNGVDWRVLAYNVDNWIPFACFVLMGAVAGYTRDRMRNDLTFLRRDKDELEQRYIFLNELYVSALQNKSQFKNQIMSYRDSFGRIFEVTRRLDTVLADEVFKEALAAMEDILDNQSICLYSIDKNSHFGRLMVCSKAIGQTTGKSLDLSQYGLMTPSFEEGEVWSNTGRLLGYPDYAAPIYRDGSLVALVTIQKVKFEQMTMYYRNLIKILCGLIQASLLRAIEHDAYTEENLYLPGTRILRPEQFQKVLALKEQMEEEAISEYSLLRIAVNPTELTAVGNRISDHLRSIDVLGQGEDGALYLILTQTGEENVGVVLERLRRSGIEFQSAEAPVSGGGGV